MSERFLDKLRREDRDREEREAREYARQKAESDRYEEKWRLQQERDEQQREKAREWRDKSVYNELLEQLAELRYGVRYSASEEDYFQIHGREGTVYAKDNLSASYEVQVNATSFFVLEFTPAGELLLHYGKFKKPMGFSRDKDPKPSIVTKSKYEWLNNERVQEQLLEKGYTDPIETKFITYTGDIGSPMG